MTTELETTTPDADAAPDKWAEHRELIQLSGYVVQSVLTTMAQNPMMAASLGPEFTQEATAIANRLGELLAIVNPGFSDSEG